MIAHCLTLNGNIIYKMNKRLKPVCTAFLNKAQCFFWLSFKWSPFQIQSLSFLYKQWIWTDWECYHRTVFYKHSTPIVLWIITGLFISSCCYKVYLPAVIIMGLGLLMVVWNYCVIVTLIIIVTIIIIIIVKFWKPSCLHDGTLYAENALPKLCHFQWNV